MPAVFNIDGSKIFVGSQPGALAIVDTDTLKVSSSIDLSNRAVAKQIQVIASQSEMLMLLAKR